MTKIWEKKTLNTPNNKKHMSSWYFNIFVALVNSLGCGCPPLFWTKEKKTQKNPRGFATATGLPSGAAGTAPDAKAYIIA